MKLLRAVFSGRVVMRTSQARFTHGIKVLRPRYSTMAKIRRLSVWVYLKILRIARTRGRKSNISETTGYIQLRRNDSHKIFCDKRRVKGSTLLLKHSFFLLSIFILSRLFPLLYTSELIFTVERFNINAYFDLMLMLLLFLALFKCIYYKWIIQNYFSP